MPRGGARVQARGAHRASFHADTTFSMPSATATTAYPGYARARKKLENNARRAGKPGTAPIMRAFSFLVRVVLAAVLLPLDLLMGDAVRTGDMTRPLMGAFGVVVAYGAFRAAEVAVGIGRASSSDDVETLAAARFRVRPPAALDPCRLLGVPLLSRSSACAYTGAVARVVVEPFEVTGGAHAHARGRASGASTADVVDLETRFGATRALRVDGAVRAAVEMGRRDPTDPTYVASFPYAASIVAAEVLRWQPQFARGSKNVRALLVGGGGGNVATYAALERACVARAGTRHRRAERGEGACDVTLVEANEALAEALRVGFEGYASAASASSSASSIGRSSTSPNGADPATRNRFAIVARDPFATLREAAPGSLDVVVFDVRRDTEVRSRSSETETPATNDGASRAEREVRRKSSEFSDASRSTSAYRDARRALCAGGVAVSVAVAPAVGPGRGADDLAALADAMRAAFDEEKTGKTVKKSAVRFERVGPIVPGFAQETIVLATKTADAERAARLNYN